MAEEVTMEKIVSLAKRRGFIFQGSEIYGGLAGTWDYGPLGVALKNNIKNLWWKTFVEERDDMYGVDAAILMNEKVWEASGHTGAGFADPMIRDKKTGAQYRLDHLLEDNGIDPTGMNPAEMAKAVSENGIKSPEGNEWGETSLFNLMFETKVGAQGDQRSYLRPETAQGIFVNFKNVIDTMRPKLPFGIAQVGKAFRNEIAPRDFIFRTREFEQMEIEYFVHPEKWEDDFENLREAVWEWLTRLGLSSDNIREYEVPKDELAHYSKRTIDFEYNYPGKGFDELLGLAYRTDHDLVSHIKASGEKLVYTPLEGEPFVPHVIEPSFGVERALMAALADAYTEDEMNGEKRTVLKLKPELAPVKAAVFPLLKNKPELVTKAREVYTVLKKDIPHILWDDNGNVGKRYRRQDEIGTPYCVTIDFDTLEDNTVTVRDRDTGEQKRVATGALTQVVQVVQ